MTDEARLRDALDRWGADTDAWPDRERRWAAALLTRSAEARDILSEAALFERSLFDAAPAADPDRMRRAVLEALPPRQPMRPARIWNLGWIGGLGAAAASLLVCFYLGAANPGVWPGADPTEAGDEPGLDSMLLGIGFDGDSL